MQPQIQGEEVRVNGKSRDDLQSAIALIRGGNRGSRSSLKLPRLIPAAAECGLQTALKLKAQEDRAG